MSRDMHTAQLYSLAQTPQPPHHWASYTRVMILVSKDRRHLFVIVTPWSTISSLLKISSYSTKFANSRKCAVKLSYLYLSLSGKRKGWEPSCWHRPSRSCWETWCKAPPRCSRRSGTWGASANQQIKQEKVRWTSFADFCTDWLFPHFLLVSLTDFFTYCT